jgi:hypothetical protein
VFVLGEIQYSLVIIVWPNPVRVKNEPNRIAVMIQMFVSRCGIFINDPLGVFVAGVMVLEFR